MSWPYCSGLTGCRARSRSATAACAGVGASLTSHHLAEVGVLIIPGQTAATRTPRAESSSRRWPASARTAATWAILAGRFTNPGCEAVGAVGVGYVEDFAADLRPTGGHGGHGLGDPVEVAAGEVDGVLRVHPGREPFDQGEAEALGGAGDNSGSGHNSTLG